MAGSHLTKDFFSLVKSIGESKSKQEEDRIITFEVKKLKNSLKARKRNRKQAREFLIRIIYCEMLGHDCSFGYIRGIELCASGSLHHKRAGYLCASLTLHPEHEFRFMLVNQLQNDLCVFFLYILWLLFALYFSLLLSFQNHLLQHYHRHLYEIFCSRICCVFLAGYFCYFSHF